MTATPEPAAPWAEQLLQDIAAADARIEHGRDEMAAGGDDRALAVQRAVQAAGRGGRDQVAALLGTSVGQVDVAIRRAKGINQPAQGLPHDTLVRLYALELSGLPPQDPQVWHAVRAGLHGVFVDGTWLHDPAGILASEIEELAGEELDEDLATRAAVAVRSWTRIQALAVITAVQANALHALPGWTE